MSSNISRRSSDRARRVVPPSHPASESRDVDHPGSRLATFLHRRFRCKPRRSPRYGETYVCSCGQRWTSAIGTSLVSYYWQRRQS